MKASYLALGVASALAFAAAPVFADHNSPNEEGWANMPNDIHNTRIDANETGDNEAFREFVQYGEGADSVNRFADEDTASPGMRSQNGNDEAAQAQARQMSGTQTQEMSGAQTQTKQMGGTQTRSAQMGGTQTKTQEGAAVETRTRTQLKDGTGTGSRAKDQRRTRYDPATGSNARRHDRRQGSGRRGGGKG